MSYDEDKGKPKRLIEGIRPMKKMVPKKMDDEEIERKKAGGAVKGRALGGRLDKRARGGRMTPKSPFSGADVKKMSYESTIKGVDTGGRKALP